MGSSCVIAYWKAPVATRRSACSRIPFAQDAQRQHGQLVLAVFEKSEAEWAWVDNRVWRARYGARTGDLRKALDWCFSDEGDVSLGVNLAVSAIRLWNEQSSIYEQLCQVDRALNRCASTAVAPWQKATLAIVSGMEHDSCPAAPCRNGRSLELRTQLRRTQRRRWSIPVGNVRPGGLPHLHGPRTSGRSASWKSLS